MEIVSYIGAFGMGGIIVKLLDGFWLQRVVANKERVAWLSAYSKPNRPAFQGKSATIPNEIGHHSEEIGHPMF